MNVPPLVAVVILNWNGRHYLQQFLPSVLASTYPNLQIVVADNASTDDSIAFLQEHFPSVQVIALSKNFGFAKGYNEALQQVQAPYFVLLNSDVEVTPNWLQPIVELLQQNKNAAACQPKILAHHHPEKFEYAGAAGGWIDSLGYPFARGRIFDVCETDTGQYNASTKIFWATGAALVIKAECFFEVGGFDEYFFAHMEEIDLCWRLQLCGYNIFACPASVVYHVGGGTLPKGHSRKTYLNFRNNAIMLAKNLPCFEKWWKIPVRFLLDQAAAFKNVLAGDAGYFFAVTKAQAAFLYWVFFGKKKKTSAATKRLLHLNGVFHKSIVKAFFIDKKHRFSDLDVTRGEKAF